MVNVDADSSSSVYIERSVRENCYAMSWSYGEICVGCGCCSNDPYRRTSARIEYCEYMLDEKKNFDGWFYERPDILEVQKKNIDSDIKYYEKELKTLREELEKMRNSE